MVARYTALVAATEIWPTPPAMVFRVPPKKLATAAAEDGQRQTGDVLVGPEGDGQEAVQQTAQGRQRCKAASRGSPAGTPNRRDRDC